MIIGKEKENLTLACYTLGGIPRGKTMWYHGMKKLAMNNDNSEWTNYSFIRDKNTMDKYIPALQSTAC